MDKPMVTTVTETDDDADSNPRQSTGAPRYSRRLSDKILIAFHHACDQGDYEIAEQLLHILETPAAPSRRTPTAGKASKAWSPPTSASGTSATPKRISASRFHSRPCRMG